MVLEGQGGLDGLEGQGDQGDQGGQVDLEGLGAAPKPSPTLPSYLSVTPGGPSTGDRGLGLGGPSLLLTRGSDSGGDSMVSMAKGASMTKEARRRRKMTSLTTLRETRLQDSPLLSQRRRGEKEGEG